MSARDQLRWALDPPSWAREVLGLELDPWQARCLRLRPHRLALNCSRGVGKSAVAAVDTAHEAIFRPGSLSLICAPSARQSEALMRTAGEFVERAGKVLQPTKYEDAGFGVDGGGVVVALPDSNNKLRGFHGATLLLYDEAAWVPDDVYELTQPFISISDGRELMMSTPNGKRGFFWRTCEDHHGKGNPAYTVERIMGRDCPRVRPGFLEEQRLKMGKRKFSQEYECEFLALDGAVFDPVGVEQSFSEEGEGFDL